jgi:hypothetical protein
MRTVSLPVPAEPEVITIQDTLLAALHGHPLEADTTMLRIAPEELIVSASGEIEVGHEAPLWLTAIGTPLTSTSPWRAVVDEFALT